MINRELMTPPSAINIEQSILAGCMLYPEQLDDAVESLVSVDFYKPAHQKIFNAIADMADKGEPVDISLLYQELERRGCLEEIGGVSYLHNMLDTPIPVNMGKSCKIIKDCSLLRKTLGVCNAISNKCFRPDADDDAEGILSDAQMAILSLETNDNNFISMRDLTTQSMERYENAYQNRGTPGIKTGFLEFDSLTGGLRGSKLVIIAARTRMGKTALMLNMVKHMATHGHKVGVLSLEMDKEDLDDRLMGSETGIDTLKLYTGQGISKQDWADLNNVAGKKYEWPIIIDDTGGLKTAELKRRARKMKKQGCGVIFIDQLSKIVGDRRKSKFEETTGIVEEIDKLKKELHMPIVLLAQIKRIENDRRPRLEDLKNTGQIEEDSDMVLIIHRPYEYNRKPEEAKDALLDLAKNRFGLTKPMKIEWDAKTTTFSNPEQR